MLPWACSMNRRSNVGMASHRAAAPGCSASAKPLSALRAIESFGEQAGFLGRKHRQPREGSAWRRDLLPETRPIAGFPWGDAGSAPVQALTPQGFVRSACVSAVAPFRSPVAACPSWMNHRP